MRKIIPSLFIFLLFALSLTGQQDHSSAYVPGEVMVQLENGSDINKVVSDYRSFGINNIQTISERFNIFLLTFDTGKTSNDALISAIRNEEGVLNIQNNHRISLREEADTSPNDSLFNYQWALKNFGQNGGKFGADIDATDAWDIETGGFTAHGDTIVVAIIDGGGDLNHEDLNHWKNKAEIPNNDIDDDSNGFVDDYHGWNAFTHTGEIPLHNHGVHVSGIAGAIGNNQVGVSGVNWDVQILPVAGASTSEAVVVEALSYVYVIRERYDSTDGAEGAFIVAENCSFGVDKGQPEDFPIWEAMYDSLGKIGVLNIAATANKGWDIDSVGDVPTAFTTDYMISVTNTTNKDEHYPNAGYGDTTIDLGAPGSLIRSLRINNAYGNSSGCSMATPHVTGAVALLFAAADSSFIANYKTNPGEYALMIKDYILGGVDPIETLEGRSVTGGRLNVFNSMNLLLNSPALGLDSDKVYGELLQDDVTNDTLTLTNIGGDTLTYTITVNNPPDWLTVSQTEGSLPSQESDNIIFTFNSEGLDTGFYNSSITISGEDISPMQMPVIMHVVTDVGVEELNSAVVRVYPNPFDANVTFEVSRNNAGDMKAEVFDAMGRLVFSEERTNARTESIEWRNELQDSGIYFYRLSIDGQVAASGKLLKK